MGQRASGWAQLGVAPRPLHRLPIGPAKAIETQQPLNRLTAWEYDRPIYRRRDEIGGCSVVSKDSAHLLAVRKLDVFVAFSYFASIVDQLR